MIERDHKSSVTRYETRKILLAAEANGMEIEGLRYFSNLGKSSAEKQDSMSFELGLNTGSISLHDFLFLVYLCGGHIVYDYEHKEN